MKVLVVEDEKALAHALDLKLTSAGFGVTVAVDGEEALADLARGHYDIMLLDLVMPKKDGFAVLEALKAKKIEMPVIVLSNLSQVEDERKAKELGVIDFWVKADITLVEVVSRIKKLLKISS